jgi:hypothetical protein
MIPKSSLPVTKIVMVVSATKEKKHEGSNNTRNNDSSCFLEIVPNRWNFCMCVCVVCVCVCVCEPAKIELDLSFSLEILFYN